MSLAKIQLLDLIRQRHRVYLEKEHLEKEEIVKANLHLERIIKDRKRATQKMQALARRPPADTAPEPKRNNTGKAYSYMGRQIPFDENCCSNGSLLVLLLDAPRCTK